MTSTPDTRSAHILRLMILLPFAAAWMVFVSSAAAQNLLEPQGKVMFERLSAEAGLSQGTVHCMLQDRRGFVWIGTADGLNKFDGYGFVHYHHRIGNPRSISDNTVNALLETSDGVLWIATNDGLNRFDPVTEEFTHYRNIPHDRGTLSSNRIYSLLEGDDGVLWVGTIDGLNRLDRRTGRCLHFPHGVGEPHVPGFEKVTALAFEPSSKHQALLVGTWGTGLLRFDLRSGRFHPVYRDHRPDSDQGPSWVSQIYVSDDGKILVADGGIHAYDPVKKRLRLRWPDRGEPDQPSVYSILKTRDGAIYAGLQYDGGLMKLDRNFHLIRHFRNDPRDATSLSEGWVNCLFQDDGGVIWIGTGDGLSTLIPARQRFLNYGPDPAVPGSLSGGQVTCVLVRRSGQIWIGTRRNGITVVDRTRRKVWYIRGQRERAGALNTDEIISLAEDSRGRMWIGTWGGGLNLYDEETGRFLAFKKNPNDPASIPDNFVAAICESDSGELWVGTTGGVGVLNLDSAAAGRFKVYRHDADDSTSLGDRRADAVFEDRYGTIWVGTKNGGVSRFDRKTRGFTHFRHDPYDSTTLSGNKILCFREDHAGNLWIGTWGGGLDRFDREHQRFTHFTEETGLPNAQVVSIVEDGKGRLWVATNNGLSRFDAEHGTFRNYDLRDGLPGYRYNRGAMTTDPRTGEILVGGRVGLTVFHPDSIEGPAQPPPVTLTAIHLTRLSEGQSHSVAVTGSAVMDTLVLTASDNIVTIEFSALDFRNPSRNEYAWKLEGFQETWVPIGTRHEVTFTDLSPGDYVLFIRGANSDGIWNEAGRRLIITVLPSWWASTFAYVLYALIVAAVVLGFIFLTRRRIVRKERALRDRRESELRFQTIAAQSRALQAENQRKELELRKAEELQSAYRALEEAHEYLQSAQTRLSGILALASDAFISVDENQRISLFNSTAEQIFGYRQDEILGQPLERILPDEFVSRHLRLEVQSGTGLEANRRYAESLRVFGLRKDGSEFPAEASISRLELSGEVIHTVMLRDITRRLKTQDKLEQLSRAVEQSPSIVIITNTRGDIEYVNPKFTEVTGYAVDEILGQNPRLLKSELTQKIVYINMWRALKSGKEWRGELQNTRKDGSTYWVSSSVSSIRNSDGEVTHYIGIQEDITDRKATEQKLMEHTEDLEMINRIVKTVNREFDLMRLVRMLLEQGLVLLPWADAGAVLIREETDPDYRIVDVIGLDGDGARNMVPDEEINRGLLDGVTFLREGLFLVDQPSALSHAAKCGLPDVLSLLVLAVRWSGVEHGEEHASYILFGSRQGKTPIAAKDVVRISQFREHAVSALAKASALRMLQNKNTELLQTQEKLIMQQKMASLGQLTAGIAHEIRNPLNFVNNFAISAIELIDEIQQANGTGEETGEMFQELRLASERILDHGRRANSIVASMLLHARRNAGIRQSMNINAMLQEATDLAYHGMRARVSDFTVSIVRHFDENVPELHGVQQDISRVFLNLLNNALFAVRQKKEAMPAGSAYIPEVTVRSQADEEFVEVHVSDNGTGISAEAAGKIFQPFYTTKTSGEGTGLGLSLSYDIIVNGYGGDLLVNPDHTDGAEFVIRLPIRTKPHVV